MTMRHLTASTSICILGHLNRTIEALQRMDQTNQDVIRALHHASYARDEMTDVVTVDVEVEVVERRAA